MYISYKINGRWSNPKSLGSKINDGPVNKWGPFVTADNKYLFYTRGDVPHFHTYWVRFDRLLDSLRTTNFVPYQLNTIPNIVIKALEPFSYTIPEDVFIDDNGIESLHFEVEMANGDPWPEYLDFDPQTRTLSGMFSDLGQLYLKITVTDQEGFQLSDRFYLEANTFTGTESECLQRAVSLAPNPAFGLVTIQGVEAARVNRITSYNVCYTKLLRILPCSISNPVKPGKYALKLPRRS